MIRLRTFDEAVYGNMAVVYHRTSASDLINKVYTSGFKPGGGSMYGKGFYSTYELTSQEGSNMADTYGSVVIKFVVPIEHFLIFDPEIYMKSPLYSKLKSKVDLTAFNRPGRSVETFSYLLDQMKYFSIGGNTDQSRIALVKKLNLSSRYTSDLALEVLKRDPNLVRRVNGIIFTGRRDGHVLVSYNTKIIMPVSYKLDGEDSFSKVELNKDYFKKMLLAKMADPLEKATAPLNVGPGTRYTVNTDGSIKWDTGEWLGGIWHGGTWDDGKWQSGTWEKGTWYGGIWADGIWVIGVWAQGTWYSGTHKDGVWAKGVWHMGLWEGGTWGYGIWNNGTWKNGDWLDGTWRNGYWVKGTWEKGDWKTGEWQDGQWMGGEWFDGRWMGGEWFDGSWLKGVWKNGIWHDGVWRIGQWTKGTWMNGHWFGGTWIDGHWWDGTWADGDWNRGTWHDGVWIKGTWNGGTWITGMIYDPDHQGNFDPSWKWEGPRVRSPISPKEYWAGIK